jgi:hypothetical protein
MTQIRDSLRLDGSNQRRLPERIQKVIDERRPLTKSDSKQFATNDDSVMSLEEIGP